MTTTATIARALAVVGAVAGFDAPPLPAAEPAAEVRVMPAIDLGDGMELRFAQGAWHVTDADDGARSRVVFPALDRIAEGFAHMAGPLRDLSMAGKTAPDVQFRAVRRLRGMFARIAAACESAKLDTGRLTVIDGPVATDVVRSRVQEALAQLAMAFSEHSDALDGISGDMAKDIKSVALTWTLDHHARNIEKLAAL